FSAPLEPCLDRSLCLAVLQHLDGFVIRDPRKRRCNLLNLADVSADGVQVTPALFKTALHDKADEVLRQFHQVIKSCVCDLWLDHPKLGEMTPRLRLLRA